MAKGPDQHEFMAEARKRFVAAKAAWTIVREDFRDDVRFVSGDPTKQWPDEIYAQRRQQEIPALTIDRCNPRVQAIINKSRRDRPQPKVGAGDTGDPEVADLIEGKVRHILYCSQADIPFDNAVMYAASGGVGAYRVVMEYTDRRRKVQEPRVKWIMDPLTCLYMDPASREPDFCDANWWFVRMPIRRDDFKSQFGSDPVPFDADLSSQWGDEEEFVWIAEYWHREPYERRHVELEDGNFGPEEHFPDVHPDQIMNEWTEPDHKVICYLVDGEKVIEETPWIGSTIPIYLVTGKQIVHDGKRRFVSAIRYTKDPQYFLNASFSEVAISFGTANMNGWTGPSGSFKDPKWRSNKRELYREWEPVTSKDGVPQPPPLRDTWSPPIQHLVQGVSLAADAIQGAMGYTDRVVRPSQSDISGVAVERREEQTDAANTQYEDNLVASQWRLGKDLVELIIKSTDTPRLMTARGEDGSERKVPIAVPDETGQTQMVPGHENKAHYRLDMGNYDVSISVGPGYATKTEEESDFIAQVMQALGPQIGVLFLDLIFKKKGYSDLQKRAELVVPQIQQAIQASNPQQEMPPQAMRAQLVQLAQQNQQLKAGLMQLMEVLKGKQVEAQGRLDVENTKQRGELARQKLNLAGDLMKMQHEHAHDHAEMMHTGRMDAIELITNLLHESNMAQQDQQHQANMAAMQPQPQPAGAAL
jgi:hypothetical protein